MATSETSPTIEANDPKDWSFQQVMIRVKDPTKSVGMSNPHPQPLNLHLILPHIHRWIARLLQKALWDEAH